MEYLRKVIYVLVIVLGMNSQITAQPGGEKIEQLRIAFLTEQLDLSVSESQQFWPLYNEYRDQKHELEQQLRKLAVSMKDQGAQSEKNVGDAIQTMSEIKHQVIAVEQEYFSNALPVLGPEKTLKLVRADERFKQALLERMKDRNNQGRNPGNRNRP